MINKYSGIIAFSVFLFVEILNAQSIRGLVNDGVDKYDEKKFPDAEVNFKKGIEKSPDNFNAHFNIGDSYFKQQRYDEAIKSFQQALVKTEDKNLKSKVFHNIGNSLLKAQKLKESVGAYKEALKLNPNDMETKYNLSYALNMMKNQQQNQQNQNQKNDNKQDQKDKDQQDKQDNQDQNKDNQQQQNQQNEAKQDNTQQQQQKAKEDKQKMSKEEAERILNALKNNELDLQKKIRKHKGKKVVTEKDW